ncbi:MAG: lipoprotein [Candidatus Marinimicrobia bacterium]|nr:lipoprotein [Candidatus Neomarinimicrobiota bacterium]
MKKFLVLIFLTIILTGCQSKYAGVPRFYEKLLDRAFVKAGENASEMMTALAQTPMEQKEAMAFLISYMPEMDLKSLPADFLLENVEYAYRARAKFPWCAALPDSVFFNEVLPYANISEEREMWRKDFYNRFSKYVENTDDMLKAIFIIADTINEETGVEYNTKRSRVDISPLKAIEEKMATCTGLSILLTDVYRSVGIPSRLAGTPMWTNYKGNHTWSEVLVNGQWHFIEYYPDTLDRSWFNADAGKADPDNPLHWIYAVSYKPTGEFYYASGLSNYLVGKIDKELLPERLRKYYDQEKHDLVKYEKPYVHGVNVTQRYIDIYKKDMEKMALANDELWAGFVVLKNKNDQSSHSRIKCRVEVYLNDEMVNFGYSPKETDDLNQFLKLKLKKNTDYKIIVKNGELEKDHVTGISTQEPDDQEFKIFLGLE